MSKARVAQRKPATQRVRSTVSAAEVRREIQTVLDVKERLYGIVEGFMRLEDSRATVTSAYQAPGRFDAKRREEYLRRVLNGAIGDEAISLGALAERLTRLTAPAEVA
jgi:hypothetical protein